MEETGKPVGARIAHHFHVSAGQAAHDRSTDGDGDQHPLPTEIVCLLVPTATHRNRRRLFLCFHFHSFFFSFVSGWDGVWTKAKQPGAAASGVRGGVRLNSLGPSALSRGERDEALPSLTHSTPVQSFQPGERSKPAPIPSPTTPRISPLPATRTCLVCLRDRSSPAASSCGSRWPPAEEKKRLGSRFRTGDRASSAQSGTRSTELGRSRLPPLLLREEKVQRRRLGREQLLKNLYGAPSSAWFARSLVRSRWIDRSGIHNQQCSRLNRACVALCMYGERKMR